MCAALAVDNISRDHRLAYFLFGRALLLERKGIGKRVIQGKGGGVDNLLLIASCTSDFLGSETTTCRISVVLCGTSSLLTGETNLVRKGYKSFAKRESKKVGSATRVRNSRGSIPRSDPTGGERSPKYSMGDILLLSELLESFVLRFLDFQVR